MLTGKAADRTGSRSENDLLAVVWTGPDGTTIWPAGSSHLVGILLGHHGTGHLLRHLRHGHCIVCLLCGYETGAYFYLKFLVVSLSDHAF